MKTLLHRVPSLLMIVSVLVGLGAASAAAYPAGPTRAGHSPRSGVPSATVAGPITGGSHGRPFPSYAAQPSPVNLRKAGYVEREYFLQGTARSYVPAGPWGSDGRWPARAASTAPYRTRMLVERPANPRRFNGTVVVEWLNVSAQTDIPADFEYEHEQLLRDGFAWVGVSAQQLGVSGSPYSLSAWDPARYGSLSHPGDSFSYDIFSQAGKAVRHPRGAAPLAGLKVHRLLADGESQSAMRMVTYIDAIQPLARVFDGFLVHSRGEGGAPLSQAPQQVVNPPSPAFVRTDSRVPVL